MCKEGKYNMKKNNDLTLFLVGIIMLVAGLYWFMSSVTVTTGFFSFTYGGFRIGGLVVVPFIAGVCWVFANPSSFVGKLVMVLGIVLIIASIIAGTTFYFKSQTLYEYLVMLVCMVGGFTLVMKVLLADRRTSHESLSDSDIQSFKKNKKDMEKLQRELEKMKK